MSTVEVADQGKGRRQGKGEELGNKVDQLMLHAHTNTSQLIPISYMTTVHQFKK